ncbi:MAG: hypothetical protein JWR69_3299 [Pedosphaera sp.]|nr:hypothetical protein [Pedosphaera sp.]
MAMPAALTRPGKPFSTSRWLVVMIQRELFNKEHMPHNLISPDAVKRPQTPGFASWDSHFVLRKHGQRFGALIQELENLMSLLQRVCKTLGILGLAVAFPSLVLAQSGYITNGVEYAPVGNLPGDQVNPALALNASGGYLVWSDNITDGSGFGISAVRLDSSYSPTLGNFRINLNGTDEQEKPQVTLLKGGGAAIVWQGGKQSFQHIYATFLSTSNTFVVRDVQVNTATNWQSNPVIATLANGNVIVAWSSFGQDNADRLQGVYAQLMTPTGVKTNGEFLVNQTTAWNQRTPAVAALSSGNFVVAWVSEKQGFSQSVDAGGTAGPGADSVQIYARLFNSSGVPLGNEFLVNTSTNVCANPNIAAASDGTFLISWSQKDVAVVNNSWDVFARRFLGSGAGGAVQRLNTQRYGDQYAPKISAAGSDYLVVWTSMGQDGSREGVFGQFVHGDGSFTPDEFKVNTTVLNQQMYPTVASDGVGRFLVVWSSYVGGVNSLDLNAQRYATYQQPLAAPGAPVVTALDSFTLSAAWSALAGYNVDHWELYVDGTNTVVTTNTFWQNQGLFNSFVNEYSFDPGTTHAFQLAYVLADGRHSPLSAVATGKTWGQDRFGGGSNHLAPDGLPDDWQTLYWGTNKTNWLASDAVLPGGATVYQVFQWGGNPFDPSTWLKTKIDHNFQGWFLTWNTKVGAYYQVQTSTDLLNWTNLGAQRFAAGVNDSLYLGLANKGYYRITRLVY